MSGKTAPFAAMLILLSGALASADPASPQVRAGEGPAEGAEPVEAAPEAYVYGSELNGATVLVHRAGETEWTLEPGLRGGPLRRLDPKARDGFENGGYVVDVVIGVDGGLRGIAAVSYNRSWLEILLRPEQVEVLWDDPNGVEKLVVVVEAEVLEAAPELGVGYRPRHGQGALVFEMPPEEFPITASRSFAGPLEYPAEQFAGYGIVAFNLRPPAARARVFCEAFRDVLLTDADLEAAGVPVEMQMVTIWPIASAEKAEAAREDDARACNLAVEAYGFTEAQLAIAAANRVDSARPLTGNGPFLLAWSPGRTKGQEDALVLVADLSGVRTLEQAHAEFLAWRDQIQLNPELWSPEGWSVEAVRVAIQRWADRRAPAVLALLGIKS